MTTDSRQDFITMLFGIEPFLASDARRSLRSIKAILDCFPGQSAAEVEKAVKALVQNDRKSVPAIAKRAQALLSGFSEETRDGFLKDFKKLSLADLAKVGKALGIELSGAKNDIVADLARWIESRGRTVPLSAKQRAAHEAQEYASQIQGLMQHVTDDNSGPILDVAEAAYKALKKEGFEAFAHELGVTVNGSKATMKKQFKNFVNRLAITDTQTKF